MRYVAAVVVFCVVVAGVLSAPPAGAQKPFFEQFKALYVKPKTSDHTMQIFNAGVEKKGCGICHRGQQARKVFNPYGQQLSKLLTKGDAANPLRIKAALKTVETIKFQGDPKSLTFGQRIRQGKLPAGEIHVRTKDGSIKDSSAFANDSSAKANESSAAAEK